MRLVVAPAYCLLIAATLGGPLSQAQNCQNSNRPIVIHITASGIDPHAGRKDNQPAPARLYSNLPAESSKVLLMPPNEKLDSMSLDGLTGTLAGELLSSIPASVDKCFCEFEISLYEYMNVTGYAFSSEQERRTGKFGAAAYEAIGVLVNELEARGRTVIIDLTLGSHATTTFAKNLSHWSGYADEIALVIYVDGRAGRDEIAATIGVLGQNKIGLINTKRDILTRWFNNTSIGRSTVAAGLKKDYPDIVVLWLVPTLLSPDKTAHVAAITDPRARFDVYERRCTAEGLCTDPVLVAKGQSGVQVFDYIRSRSPQVTTSPQQPIRWVAWDPEAGNGDCAAEAAQAADKVAGARRVLMFGDGPLAKELYDEMVRRLGAANVVWDRDIRDAETARRRARELAADSIVGVIPLRLPKMNLAKKRPETKLKRKSNDFPPPCPPGTPGCGPDGGGGGASAGPPPGGGGASAGPPPDRRGASAGPPPGGGGGGQRKKVGGVSANIEIRPGDVAPAPQRKQ